MRTGYSFRTAVGHLPDVISRIKETGSKFAPIADRNSTFGFVKWAKLCKEAGLLPIYGVELGVVPELGAKKPVIDYWRFFATDDLKPLHKLIYQATANPGKEPQLLYRQAYEALNTGLIAVAGERVLLDHIQPAQNFFLGLSPSTSKGLLKGADAKGIRLFAQSDNYFPRQQDEEFYRITLGWRGGTQTYPRWILSDDEWKEATQYVASVTQREDALSARERVFSHCKAALQTATILTPEKPKSLRQLCEEGAREKNCDLNDPTYATRLEKELALIAEKQFEDYFFIISDMVKWAKQRMVVGPARGSSCGSLACYLLDITAIDPIPFGLIFERFIDTTRKDLPDIDLDFSDTRRHLVFEYAEHKYGKNRVARLGTVGMFKPRSALKGAGEALQIPKWKTEKVLDSLIQRSSGDSRALQALEDTLNDTEAGRKLKTEHPEILIAGRMEGHPNNASQHAAGIVITNEPVGDYVAIDARTGATMCDKYDAEALNLLKIDALGLTQLSIFERTLELLGRPSVTGFLETLPLDDQASFDVLNRGHFSGVFQFNGGALKSLTKQVDVNHIEDIIAITSLARPGPMATGGANEWVKRRVGQNKVTYPHDAFKEHLDNTLGIVIYQEQVMQIGRVIGDLSWEDVTALRKAMSKSLGKEYFDKFGDRWKDGARKKGIPDEVLTKTWDDLCAYGAWSFNRSHAVAYGLVSYWCCWLKAHHPVEFAAATLDAESEPERQIALLRELALEGVTYVPVDAEHSVDRWTVAVKGGKKTLVGPLTSIKGIGPATVNEIIACRRAHKPLRPTILKRLNNAKTQIDSLTPVRDSVLRLHPDLSAINIVSTPTNIIDAQCGVYGDVVIIGVANKIAPRDENEQVNIAKRGGRVLTGPTASLNLFVRDDTDEIFCKVNRFDMERIGRQLVEHGVPKKTLVAIKGTIPKDFRMISVKQIKILGKLDDA